MLGDNSVGKTSLVRRFVFDMFEDSYISTIGSKSTVKVLNLEHNGKEEELKLVIWDIMGRVGYSQSHARMLKGAKGAFLVTDLTRKETLDNLEQYWIPLLYGVVENVPLIFISNKVDLADDMEYDPRELEDIASRYNRGMSDSVPDHLYTSYLTSAKTGENVESAFESLGHLLLSKKAPWDPVKDLYNNLLANGNVRGDENSIIEATDSILVDFCNGVSDEKLALLMLRQEIIRSRLDINDPSLDGLIRLIEFMADAETEYKDNKIVVQNREKRLSWAQAAGH
jgi:small GTP-binding protein